MTKKQLNDENFGYPLRGEKGFTQCFFNKRSKFSRQTIELKNAMKIENHDNGKYQRILSPLLLELWKKAKDLKDFEELIKDNSKARLTYFASQYLKGDWYYLRSLLGDKKVTLYADAGGVKVGSDKFNFIISSGGGDGKVRMAVFENEDEFQDGAFSFFTILSGEFNIYSYDCGNEIEITLNGRYAAYAADGFVCFVKLRG